MRWRWLLLLTALFALPGANAAGVAVAPETLLFAELGSYREMARLALHDWPQPIKIRAIRISGLSGAGLTADALAHLGVELVRSQSGWRAPRTLDRAENVTLERLSGGPVWLHGSAIVALLEAIEAECARRGSETIHADLERDAPEELADAGVLAIVLSDWPDAAGPDRSAPTLRSAQPLRQTRLSTLPNIFDSSTRSGSTRTGA